MANSCIGFFLKFVERGEVYPEFFPALKIYIVVINNVLIYYSYGNSGAFGNRR